MESSPIIVFVNCTILTMDQKNTISEAMAIYKEKIVAVGSREQVLAKVNNLTSSMKNGKIEVQEVNLNGACVVPGFIDAHIHPALYIYYKTQLRLTEIRSYSELTTALKKEEKRRKSGDWIVGLDLMEDKFEDPQERHFPNKYDLDSICKERPIMIVRYDGHICSVNSRALEILGIDASNVKKIEVTSGEIQVDKEDIPTGVFTEGAMSLPTGKISMPDGEQLKVACSKFSEELASFGITTCGTVIQLGEVGVAGKGGAMEWPMMKLFISNGAILQDLVVYFATDRPRKIKRETEFFRKLNTEENRFVLGGLKVYADGSLGARTALMFEPYTDSPDKTDGISGLMVTKKERLYELFKEAHSLGFQIACHSIGDKANEVVIETFMKLAELTGNNLAEYRHRIEHASLVLPDSLKKASYLGLIFVMQPNFINSEYKWIKNRLGPQRIKYLYAFRSILDAEIMLAGASDGPIELANVLQGIQAAVTRNGFVLEQSITIDEALKMFTWNAAYSLKQEKIKGSLEEGKLADFVILKQDIRKAPKDKISHIKILATYKRGLSIYSSN